MHSINCLFLWKTGNPLHGYCDDSRDLQELPYANHGNFVALLNFKVQSGDKVIAEHHLKSTGHSQNALYTNNTTQNELIDVCGHIIHMKSLREILTAQFFPL